MNITSLEVSLGPEGDRNTIAIQFGRLNEEGTSFLTSFPDQSLSPTTSSSVPSDVMTWQVSTLPVCLPACTATTLHWLSSSQLDSIQFTTLLLLDPSSPTNKAIWGLGVVLTPRYADVKLAPSSTFAPVLHGESPFLPFPVVWGKTVQHTGDNQKPQPHLKGWIKTASLNLCWNLVLIQSLISLIQLQNEVKNKTNNKWRPL